MSQFTDFYLPNQSFLSIIKYTFLNFVQMHIKYYLKEAQKKITLGEINQLEKKQLKKLKEEINMDLSLKLSPSELEEYKKQKTEQIIQQKIQQEEKCKLKFQDMSLMFDEMKQLNKNLQMFDSILLTILFYIKEGKKTIKKICELLNHTLNTDLQIMIKQELTWASLLKDVSLNLESPNYLNKKYKSHFIRFEVDLPLSKQQTIPTILNDYKNTLQSFSKMSIKEIIDYQKNNNSKPGILFRVLHKIKHHDVYDYLEYLFSLNEMFREDIDFLIDKSEIEIVNEIEAKPRVIDPCYLVNLVNNCIDVQGQFINISIITRQLPRLIRYDYDLHMIKKKINIFGNVRIHKSLQRTLSFQKIYNNVYQYIKNIEKVYWIGYYEELVNENEDMYAHLGNHRRFSCRCDQSEIKHAIMKKSNDNNSKSNNNEEDNNSKDNNSKDNNSESNSENNNSESNNSESNNSESNSENNNSESNNSEEDIDIKINI